MSSHDLARRARKAGATRGFFGQLNANIQKRRDNQAKIQERIEVMKANQKVWQSQFEYKKKAGEQATAKERARNIKAAGGAGSTGAALFEQQEVFGDTSKMSKEFLNSDLQRRMATGKSSAPQVGGNPSKVLTAPIESTAITQVGTQETQAFAGATPDPLAAPEVQGVPGTGLVGEPGIAGEQAFVSPFKGPKVARQETFTEDGKKKIRFFDDQGNTLRTEELAVEPDKASGESFVHMRNPDGTIDIDKTFSHRNNKTTGEPEIFVGGEWVTAPTNIVPADKQTAFGKVGKPDIVTFTDVENRQIGNIEAARSSIKRLATQVQLKDRGLVTGAQRLFQGFSEILRANGLVGDNEDSVLQFMAKHNSDILAQGLSDSFSLTRDEKLDLVAYAQAGPDVTEDALFMKGAINALRKILPLQIVRALSDNPRPSQQLIEQVSSIVTAQPGSELAGGLSEFLELSDGREKSIYKQKYSADSTPAGLKKAGWNFTGEIQREPEGGLSYRVQHRSGRIFAIPVRSNLSAEELNSALK